jgi:hypothetical protein
MPIFADFPGKWMVLVKNAAGEHKNGRAKTRLPHIFYAVGQRRLTLAKFGRKIRSWQFRRKCRLNKCANTSIRCAANSSLIPVENHLLNGGLTTNAKKKNWKNESFNGTWRLGRILR